MCVCVCRTPLMLAVMGGHVDAVSLLLEREASVDLADDHGLTALHLGVRFLMLSNVFMYKDFVFQSSLFLSLSSCVDRRNVFSPCWSWRHPCCRGTPRVGQLSIWLRRGVTHPGWANCSILHVLNPRYPHSETTRDTHPYTGPVTMVGFNSLHYDFKKTLLFIS